MMLRLKLVSKKPAIKPGYSDLGFEAQNERGESHDFWPTGKGYGTLVLIDVMPAAAAMFETDKFYELIIHEKH